MALPYGPLVPVCITSLVTDDWIWGVDIRSLAVSLAYQRHEDIQRVSMY